MKKCKYRVAWKGACGKPVVSTNYCEDHQFKICCACGKPATRECDETFMFVCGEPLSDKCKCTRIK